MATNAGANIPDGGEARIESSNPLMDAMRASRDRIAFLTSLGIATLGFSQQATAEDIKLAQADITPVAMTDANLEVEGEAQTITRETLKGYMNEGLHEMIDAIPDDALAYLSPIIIAAENTIENERYRNSFITGMIGVFLQPDLADFNQGIERFARAGLVIDEGVVATAGAYIGTQQDRILLERGEIVLALATQEEIIARQRERITALDAEIARLQAQSAELQAQSAELQAQSAELQAQSAELQAQSAVLQAEVARLLAMREDIIQIIGQIEQMGERQPA